MPTGTLKNQGPKSGYRVVSKIVDTKWKAICQDCGFITADDPDLPFIKTLSKEESTRWSVAKSLPIISAYACGCFGWD